MPRILRWLAVTTLVAGLVGCGSTAVPSWTYAPPSSPSVETGAGRPTPHPGDHSAVPANGTIEAEAFDLGFTPAALTVPSAGTYDVSFRNTGSVPHDITFADGTKIAAGPGAAASGSVTIPEGGLTFICSIPGHEQAGMKGAVTVDGAEPAPTVDGHGGPLPTGTVAADPDAPPYKLYDPTAPAVMPGTTHDIDLVITEQQMTVAPGFAQAVWTFGATVPGPVIRVKVGDRVRVHLKNPIDNKMAHSIDFHASQVAPNDEMRSIAPGQELLYEWTADYAGVWMYHCATAPALHHIANGMYGMVIVEPKDGLPKVDTEFAIVQSEWYLGPQGQESDLEKALAAAPAPDLVLFNGVANQYQDHPLMVGTGERVRIFVLNAGPSIDSSFHVIGTVFDTVRKEGVLLSRHNPGTWGSQAMDLAPAQGGYVEFVPAEDGMYPFVTHAFNFASRGALGMLQAGDGDPTH
jgi:nitrite reductase (NO-forming)